MSYYQQEESFEKNLTLMNLSFRNDQLFFNINAPVSLQNETKKAYSYFIKDINENNRNFQFYLFDIHVRGKIMNEYNELLKVNIQYNKHLPEKQLQKLAKYIEAFILDLDPSRDNYYDSKESFYEYCKDVSNNYSSYNDYQNQQSSSYQSSDYSRNGNLDYRDDFENNDYSDDDQDDDFW
jgi:hypothetical protein